MENFKKLSVLLVLIISVVFMACSTLGKGHITSQERSAEGYNGVIHNGIGNVKIHFAENYRVVVTTNSDIQNIVTIEIKNNYLYIYLEDPNTSIKPTKLEIDVYMPEIKVLNLTGVGNIDVDNGSGKDLEIILRGVGNITASNYQIKKGTIDSTGVGDIKIWVTEEINGNLAGIGEMFYKGNPKLTINVSGIARLNSIQ
jgi:hypothetical protein